MEVKFTFNKSFVTFETHGIISDATNPMWKKKPHSVSYFVPVKNSVIMTLRKNDKHET